MKFPRQVVTLLCQSQEKKRFDEALQSKYERLYRLAYAWCHQQALAQDLVQGTMLKALENRKHLDRLEHLDAWLSKIMHNLFLDHIRFNKRWEWSEASEIDAQYDAECCESHMIKNQASEACHNALAKLPFEQREAIALCDLQGFSYQEIAEITSTPIGTVMSRIARGRERLRRLLQPSEKLNQTVVPLRRT